MIQKHRSINVTLQLLGKCEIHLNNTEINSLSSKSLAILVYLAMKGNHQKRTHLANLLWSHLNESKALANLRKIIHEIKTTFTDSGSLVVADRHTLRLSPTVNFQIDALSFDITLQKDKLSIFELETVINQYHGEFLDGFFTRSAQEFEVWRSTTSSHLHNSYIRALQDLSNKHEIAGEIHSAIASMKKLLALEPLREDFHLRLMKLYWRNEQRVNAMQQYETCVGILRNELSTEPQSDITKLYNSLQNNECPPKSLAFSQPNTVKNHKFIVGPPVGSPELFFGRDAYLSRIFGWWQRPPFGHVAIIGHRRSGKTSLLQHLKPISGQCEVTRCVNQKTHWLEDNEKYRWISIDFQDPRMRALPSLLAYLLSSFGIAPPKNCTLESFMDLVTEKPWTKPTLILMDELEAGLAADELDQSFWWAMRALTQMTDGLIGIATASHEQPMKVADSLDKSSPFFNIFSTLVLGPFEETEALNYIDSIDQHYSTEERQWILKHSGHWPCLLQLLCQEKYLATQSGNGDEKWRDNALHQLQSYAYLLQ